MARDTEYTEEVSHDTPATVEALAKRLQETFHGSLNLKNARGMAQTMAFAWVSGHVCGHFGELRWSEHPDSDRLGHRKITWVWL